MTPHAAARRAIAAFALAAVACDSPHRPITEPARPAVAVVAVSSSAPSLVEGQSATLTATLTDAAGQPLTGRAVVWSSELHAVATVSPTGEVVAVAPGTVRIVATSEGKRGEVELRVLPRAVLVASVSLDAPQVTLALGETRQLTATPRDVHGAPVAGVAVAWSAAGGHRAATVSASGLVTAHEMGVMRITASVDGKLAHATVTVLGNATHDLVFDRWDETIGLMHPALHRLDMRTPEAVPLPTFRSYGSSEPAPSPDGTRIAFTCPDSGRGICTGTPDGSVTTVLHGFSEFDGMLGDQPAWSPDGSKIAFRGWSPGGRPGLFNPTDVWLMNADGSNKVRLTTGARRVDYYEAPTWSPRQADGSYRIAVSHVTRDADGYARARIESLRADGTDRRAVTEAGAFVDGEPSWSPDGRTIAFVRTGGTASGDVWLVDAGGGNERQLMAAAVEPSGAQRAPAWSPDGAQLAFASSHEIVGTYFAWQIYTVRADGTGLVRRTDDHRDKGNPAWLRRP